MKGKRLKTQDPRVSRQPGHRERLRNHAMGILTEVAFVVALFVVALVIILILIQIS